MTVRLAALVALPLILIRPASAPAAGPSHVDITWMSVSNMYYELGPLRIVTDGYITRLPRSLFSGGGGGLAKAQPSVPDVAAITRVLNALGGPSNVNLLLNGHAHFDHSFDTAVWSKLSGARIIGSKTTCLQTEAQEVAAGRCTAVYGGESIALGEGVTMRVVRWNHSGDPATNPEQHNAVELDAAPHLDPTTGGLDPGVAADFPNGGGNRGFLFVVDAPGGRFSWFFQNSASPVDLDVPIVIGGKDYGAPIENLRKGLASKGIDGTGRPRGSVSATFGAAMTEVETEIAGNRAAVEDFIATARGLDPATWSTPRAGGQWSPAQIAEHLAIVYEYTRKVITGTAGKGAPRLLRPLLRWFVVDSTLKAGKFTRKGKAPALFHPSKTPGSQTELLARLSAAVTGFEADIRSGHPAARHTVAHPFFGTIKTCDCVRLQAIHARHHRSQLT